MSGGLSMHKVRAVSGAAGQIVARLANGLIVYPIAVVTASGHFGGLALLLALLGGVSGMLRGALGTPLLRAAGRSPVDIRREGSFAVTSALLAGLIAAGAMWAVEGPGIRLPSVLIMVAAPIVLVQEVLRHVAIALGRGRTAALWDGLWFVGSSALLLAAWLHLPAATPTYLIGGWAAMAFVALIGMLAGVRALPRLSGYRGWLSDGWRCRVRYGLESGVKRTAVFAVLLVTAVAVSPGAAAALCGAAALLAPTAVVATAIPLVALPESQRLTMPPTRVWSFLARLAVVEASGLLLTGVAVVFTPPTVGELVLGRTFEASQTITLIIAFDYAMAVWIAAVTVLLRAMNRCADALTLEVSYLLATLGTALGGAMLFRTAAGVAVGTATATAFIAAGALLRFRPRRGLARYPVVERVQPTAPALDAVGHAAAAGGVYAGEIESGRTPRPIPLATSLRLKETPQVNAALITLWVFATLAVFVPAAISRFTALPTNANWLWALPLTAICAGRFAWLVGSGERRLFEMMFWGYSYAFLCLAPLAQLRENEWPETVPRVDVTYTGAGALIAIVGCCAFLAGAGVDNVAAQQRRWHPAQRPHHVVERAFTISYPRVVMLCAFAVVFNLYYLSHLGWIQFLKSREAAYYAYEAVWKPGSIGMMTRAASYMALLVAFVALMRFRREIKRARMLGDAISPTVMHSNMALIVIIGILLANSMNPISNARYLSGTAILAAATAFGLFATRQGFRLTSCGFLAGMLLIFPLADAFRGEKTELKSTNPIESLLSPDYDSFAQLMNGYLVGAREGIVPGKQFSGVLAFWLPRAVWTNKPVDTGIYIANERGYGFTNLSAPLWIEFYLNGGWLPLAIGMFALGFCLHRWDTRLNAQFEVYGMPGLLGCIVPFYMMILLRGSLLQAAPYLFFTLVFSAAVLNRKNTKARPRVPAAPLEPQPGLGGRQPRTNCVRA